MLDKKRRDANIRLGGTLAGLMSGSVPSKYGKLFDPYISGEKLTTGWSDIDELCKGGFKRDELVNVCAHTPIDHSHFGNAGMVAIAGIVSQERQPFIIGGSMLDYGIELSSRLDRMSNDLFFKNRHEPEIYDIDNNLFPMYSLASLIPHEPDDSTHEVGRYVSLPNLIESRIVATDEYSVQPANTNMSSSIIKYTNKHNHTQTVEHVLDFAIEHDPGLSDDPLLALHQKDMMYLIATLLKLKNNCRTIRDFEDIPKKLTKKSIYKSRNKYVKI